MSGLKTCKDEHDQIYRQINAQSDALSNFQTQMKDTMKYVGKRITGLRDMLISDYMEARKAYKKALNELAFPAAASVSEANHPEWKHKQRMKSIEDVYSMLYDGSIGDAIMDAYRDTKGD